VAFTCVRNPYARILSSFFDKIAGIQRNGKRYRGNLVPQLMQRYGVEVGSPEDGFDFDQIRSFRRFLLFARDTIRWRRPMEPDIHWSAMSGHIATFIVNAVATTRSSLRKTSTRGCRECWTRRALRSGWTWRRCRGSTNPKAMGRNAPTRSARIST